MFDKLVLVTRRTRFEELLLRFHSRGHAKFYLEHGGVNFTEYQVEHDLYHRSLDLVRRELDLGLPQQNLDRSLVPTYQFAAGDVVIVLGQDGLVANVAKYAGDQPLLGVNPDPARFDGILLPWQPAEVRTAVTAVLDGRAAARSVTLAEAVLNDRQTLLAFNDLFIGARSHVSARYRIRIGSATEDQSSSGVLVSTGAGSTGWMSSVFNMAAGVAAFAGGMAHTDVRLPWEDPRLLYAVREPFQSRHSATRIVAGYIPAEGELVLESLMPGGGVIFSDGVESDFLRFESGAVAHIRASRRRANLVVSKAGSRLPSRRIGSSQAQVHA
jgi:NAD kinase